MADTLQQDSDLSHGIINFINSQLRGKLAYLNVLRQVNYQSFDKDDLAKTEKELATVQRWLKDLWTGMPVLSTVWTEPQTFEAQRALDFLKDIKTQNQILQEKLLAIFQSQTPWENEEDIKLMLASYARWTYGRDNYVKGFIEYGKNFKRQDIIDGNNAAIAQTEAEVKFAGTLLKEFLQNTALPESFFTNLTQAVILLPFRFRVFIHDANQFLSIYHPVFTFLHADFTAEEADSWEILSFGSVEAGYWRAYFFSPKEALNWISQNIRDPAFAYLWKLNAFSVEDSLAWISIGTVAAQARLWTDAGYTAETTLPYLQKGIVSPDMIPAENKI